MKNGECYRCYSSRFLKSNYLGNINDKNFTLNKAPQPCVQKICTCPKPNNYKQITNETNYAKAYILKAKNLIFLPVLILKKRKIVLQKLNQYIKLTKS